MILGILQARVSSTRLPGKVLKNIMGKPMIARQLERLQRSQKIDRILVATSTDPSDDELVKVCMETGIEFRRGSLDDVLDRFYQTASSFTPEHVVRMTGDCPLADPAIIDRVIRAHLESGDDYTSNTLEPSFPDGLDVEVISFKCLRRAWQEAKLPSEREHVTLYVHQNPEMFALGCIKNSKDLSDLRWTVDEPEDFLFVSSVYEELWPNNPEFGMEHILELLERRPDLSIRNSKFQRNEGLKKSRDKDSENRLDVQ
ncbi:spore coat polysaccharide biosynthesis protein SpsF [Geothermobacter ehrlichii]|uniref:Spore coat polysaccharide biosynthesis protein SpsF n=1 Tax=Geothermobacter ehrlichii TaxID=213224 RepID=A0A5D3WIT4_9BACT|nr:glycosyltransferase family protein [Geothermobacter ehrlichii]TYO98364.1 spore coat polysaccharide biosynthesis protein SpsF [Geothermobacter ehrlichii]